MEKGRKRQKTDIDIKREQEIDRERKRERPGEMIKRREERNVVHRHRVSS